MQSVRGDDLESIATTESQWLLLETDEREEDLALSLSAAMPSPPHRAAAAASFGAAPEAVSADAAAGAAPAALPPINTASLVLHGAELRLGSNLLAQCPGHRGDLALPLESVMQAFPSINRVCNLGRIFVTAGVNGPLGLPALGRVLVQNSGTAAWPSSTTLRIVAGDAHGFDSLVVGAIPPGYTAELWLDLTLKVVPDSPHPGVGQRSAWVLADDSGEPFGPLVVLEVIY